MRVNLSNNTEESITKDDFGENGTGNMVTDEIIVEESLGDNKSEDGLSL